MLIRSQEKLMLLNLQNVANVFVYEKAILVRQITNFDDEETIGRYSSEEKAIKVLDKIQEAYAECEAYKVLLNGDFEHKKDDFLKIFKRSFVFEMPQDNEVESSFQNSKMTNAERIRKMNDEELAKFLPFVSGFCCDPTKECLEAIVNCGNCMKTEECYLKWLQAESKE